MIIMSEHQIRSSTFDWNIGENPSEVLSEFPYVCNSFSAETFPSLSVDIPNSVVNCNDVSQSRISQDKSGELFALAPESERLGYGSGVNEDFFQSFNSSSCSYVEPNSESLVKHEMPTILNLDNNFNEALTNNFELMSNSVLPAKSGNSLFDQPSISYSSEFDHFNDNLFSRHCSDLSQCHFNSFDSSGTKSEFYGRNTMLSEGLEESMDNVDAPSEWSGIGGAAVLCRSLPEGSKELLSYMRVPDEAKKRKFLTVREMLNIKKKLSNAKNKVLKDFLTCSEDSQDEQDSSDTELNIHISPESKDEASPSSPKKQRTTRASKRKKAKGQSNCCDFSDEESSLTTIVDSLHFTNTLMLTPCPSELRPPSNVTNGLGPLPALTDPMPLSTGWSQDLSDNRQSHFYAANIPPAQTVSLSPKSREVFEFVHPVQQQIGPECRNSYPDSYSRPRHFEFRLLQIGTYQFVASGNDSNERLSRLKIIFTTQKFVYEYELPSRIPYAHEGQVLVTRMISVEVPFSTVVGLDCNDTVVRMLVDTQPFVFIGYRTHYPDQSRCCVYERMADADFTHGELSTSPLHRLVLIRPEAANKLKYHLSNFNSRFASLLELPFPVANHIPHWPLRQQAIFTMPKDQSSPTISTAPGVNVEASARNTKKPCNCRLGCRSKKCSCARQGKPCLSDFGCRCNNCDNPLNVFYQWGVDIQWTTNQACLMDNIFNIDVRTLQERLQQCVTCPSCGISVNLIQIFVNMKAGCPKCNAILCYSWCKGILLPAHSKTMYHCQICESCFPGTHVHCEKCDVCVESVLPNGVCSICNQPVVCNQNTTAASLVPVQETKIW